MTVYVTGRTVRHSVMVKQNKGLISFSSSSGSACYMQGPAYGAQERFDPYAPFLEVVETPGEDVLIRRLILRGP